MRAVVQERPTRGNRRRVEAGDGSLSSLGAAGVGGGMGSREGGEQWRGESLRFRWDGAAWCHGRVESSGEVRV
jgi:hypothetical protein